MKKAESRLKARTHGSPTQTKRSRTKKAANASSNSNSIRVCSRVRPQNKMERKISGKLVVTASPDGTTVKLAAGGGYSFSFDRIFDTESKQETVFEYAAKPLVEQVLDGYNCTIFAYGQTGSGKTYTMEGKLGTTSRGVIPRIVETIFDGIQGSTENIEFLVKVSHVEIYLEKIKDLLNPKQHNLQIREGNEGIYIENVTSKYAGSAEQVMEMMTVGSANRAISSTKMNMESSRSHSVFILEIKQTDSQTNSKKSAKLMMVDLAGSEKVRKTEAAGQRLEEAKNINKSLSALGNVINALTSRNVEHIPYRDSKLTRLLSDSIGGNSKTTLIITCSPSAYNSDETLSTLRFGQRAKLIKNKAKINKEMSIQEYKLLLSQSRKSEKKQQQLIEILSREVRQLKNSVRNLGGDVSAFSDTADDATDEDSIEMIRQLQQQVEELEVENSALKLEEQKYLDMISELNSEIEIHKRNAQIKEAEKNQMSVRLAQVEGQSQELSEKLTEYEFDKQKLAFVDKENNLQVEQLKAENAVLNDRLKSMVESEKFTKKETHQPNQSPEGQTEPSETDDDTSSVASDTEVTLQLPLKLREPGDDVEGKVDKPLALAEIDINNIPHTPRSRMIRSKSVTRLPSAHKRSRRVSREVDQSSESLPYFKSHVDEDKLDDTDINWKQEMEEKCNALYEDLTRKIAQHVKLQVKYADAQCELEHFTEYINKTFSKRRGKGPSVGQLLEQNRQITRSYHQLSIENDRLRAQATYNTKTLDNWRKQMENMEHALRDSTKLHRRLKKQHETKVERLQQELDMYKSLYEHAVGLTSGVHMNGTTQTHISSNGDSPKRKGSNVVVPLTGQRPAPLSPLHVSNGDSQSQNSDEDELKSGGE